MEKLSTLRCGYCGASYSENKSSCCNKRKDGKHRFLIPISLVQIQELGINKKVDIKFSNTTVSIMKKED